MQSFLLRALLVLGVLTNIAFLLINLNPERPHLAKRRHAKVLLKSDPERAAWMKANQLDTFGAEHDIDFEVVAVPTFAAVLETLRQEKAQPTGIALAATINDISDELIDEQLVKPFTAAATVGELMEELGDDLPEADNATRGPDGNIWFLPKRAEMTIAAFLRPAVEDAYLNWQLDRPAITAALAEANGVGLPHHYNMEKSPELWDSYDLFVAAWYWAHHYAAWADPGNVNQSLTTAQPRVAFRTGRNEDALNDLLASFYRHGLQDEDLGKLDHPAVLDALQWEALFHKHHLLLPECAAGVDADGIVKLFAAGRLAWAPLNQEDSLAVHGGYRRDAEPGIGHPQRLDWAVMPEGVSLELKNDTPVRKGRSFAFEEIHLWAIPVRSSEAHLAFALVNFLTEHGMQRRETEALGMLPIRTDLQSDYPILFRLDWMQRVLQASYAQIARGTSDISPIVEEKHFDELYFAARERVLATKLVGARDVQRAAQGDRHGK